MMVFSFHTRGSQDHLQNLLSLKGDYSQVHEATNLNTYGYNNKSRHTTTTHTNTEQSNQLQYLRVIQRYYKVIS